jgi:hypothetical protein
MDAAGVALADRLCQLLYAAPNNAERQTRATGAPQTKRWTTPLVLGGRRRSSSSPTSRTRTASGRALSPPKHPQ